MVKNKKRITKKKGKGKGRVNDTAPPQTQIMVLAPVSKTGKVGKPKAYAIVGMQKVALPVPKKKKKRKRRQDNW